MPELAQKGGGIELRSDAIIRHGSAAVSWYW
jgi:hypothetical protein